MEKQGIWGEGLSFSRAEKDAANQANININFGDILGSQVQLNSPNSRQDMNINTNDIDELDSFIGEFASFIQQAKLEEETREELEAEIATLQAQIKSPKPKAKLIVETLKSIRNISEGIVGGVLTSAVSPMLPELISKFGG